MTYKELNIEERATIQIGLLHNLSLRSIARLLDRSPSTISREIRRNQLADGLYEAPKAQANRQARRVGCRPVKKLAQGNELFDLVILMLRQRFSPQQIA
ncbi:Helix-turn-helix domain-containing protein, partial [Oceanospirillum multiglobuliferum]